MNTQNNIEQSEYRRQRDIMDEQRSFCTLHEQQYIHRLDAMYNQKILTTNQYVKYHKKLDMLPVDVESRLMQIKGLLKELQKYTPETRQNPG